MDFYSAYRHGFVRVAACTHRTVLADPAANTESVLRIARECHDEGVAIAVFPELTLSGYSLEDILIAPIQRIMRYDLCLSGTAGRGPHNGCWGAPVAWPSELTKPDRGVRERATLPAPEMLKYATEEYAHYGDLKSAHQQMQLAAQEIDRAVRQYYAQAALFTIQSTVSKCPVRRTAAQRRSCPR